MNNQKFLEKIDRTIDQLIASLLDHQLDDGGFKGYHLFDKESGIWTTSEILHVLIKVKPQLANEIWASKAAKYIADLQNAAGGWGFRGKGKAVVDVTAWACLALSHFDYRDEINRGLDFLLVARKNEVGIDSGGWGLTTFEPDRIYSTWIASNCLNKILSTRSDWFGKGKRDEILEALEQAHSWIAGSKNADGGWGSLGDDASNSTSSAIALISIFSRGENPQLYQDTFHYLKDNLKGNLWGLEREVVVTQEGYELTQEWFTTVYCLRAFIFFAELGICSLDEIHKICLGLFTLIEEGTVKPMEGGTRDLIWTIPFMIEVLDKFRHFIINKRKDYENFLYQKELEEKKLKKLEIEGQLKTMFPYPISQVYFSFNHEIDPHRRFQYLVQAYEVLIKYTAVVALSTVVASNEKILQMKQLIETRFKKPTLGDWASIVEIVLRHSKSVESIIHPWCKEDLNRPAPNILDADAPKLTLNQYFSAIVALRNSWTGHGAIKSVYEYKMEIDKQVPFLFSLLNRLMFLGKCNSFLILSSNYNEFGDGDIYKIRVFNGLDISDDDLEVQKRLSEGQREQLIRYVYFHNIESNTIVNLYPFLSYMYCFECKKEHFFFFNGVKTKDQVSYLSFECGHTIGYANMNHFTKRFSAIDIAFGDTMPN